MTKAGKRIIASARDIRAFLRGETTEGFRTTIGRDVEDALGEVLAHVKGEVDLPTRTAGAPSCGRAPDASVFSLSPGQSGR